MLSFDLIFFLTLAPLGKCFFCLKFTMKLVKRLRVERKERTMPIRAPLGTRIDFSVVSQCQSKSLTAHLGGFSRAI